MRPLLPLLLALSCSSGPPAPEGLGPFSEAACGWQRASVFVPPLPPSEAACVRYTPRNACVVAPLGTSPCDAAETALRDVWPASLPMAAYCPFASGSKPDFYAEPFICP